MNYIVARVIMKLESIFLDLLQKAFITKLKYEFQDFGGGSSIQRPFIVHCPENISIGSKFIAGRNGKLRTFPFFAGKSYRPCIKIGSNVSFETNCYVSAIGHISVGDNVVLGPYVTIIDHNHSAIDHSDLEIPVMQRQLSTKGNISIDDNVWIGEHSTILSGVTIGKNSIIGANSIVTQAIPENAVAVGSPAKVIKKL